jgi:hypothetical membrane protein
MHFIIKYFKLLGIIAAILAWIIIIISVLLNPWFIFTKNAFSDLGNPNANYPQVYNFGLIIVAILSFLYGIHLILVSRNKTEVVASSYLTIASIFLALIGIFHEGTYPHAFVSVWFFVQFALVILVWGISGLLSESKKFGISMIILFIIGIVGAIILPWPSAATLESWGIIIIDISIILLYLNLYKRYKNY